LRLLAFCAPEAIPLRLLLQPRPALMEELPAEVTPVLAPLLDDELAVKDAVAALRRYSLVRPAADGAVSVHRLVQAVTADQMPEELCDAWQRAAAMLIEAAIPLLAGRQTPSSSPSDGPPPPDFSHQARPGATACAYRHSHELACRTSVGSRNVEPHGSQRHRAHLPGTPLL
jgi:hypothetical protein